MLSTKSAQLANFFAPELSTTTFSIFPKNTCDALVFPVFIRFTEQAILDDFDYSLPIIGITEAVTESVL